MVGMVVAAATPEGATRTAMDLLNEEGMVMILVAAGADTEGDF
jgi:hypothetical protein